MTLDFLNNINADYEEALVETKFGKFHYFLLAICGSIYLNTAVGITIISFVLPSATCGKRSLNFCFSINAKISLFSFVDFKMTSADKGLIFLNFN